MPYVRRRLALVADSPPKSLQHSGVDRELVDQRVRSTHDDATCDALAVRNMPSIRHHVEPSRHRPFCLTFLKVQRVHGGAKSTLLGKYWGGAS